MFQVNYNIAHSSNLVTASVYKILKSKRGAEERTSYWDRKISSLFILYIYSHGPINLWEVFPFHTISPTTQQSNIYLSYQGDLRKQILVTVSMYTAWYSTATKHSITQRKCYIKRSWSKLTSFKRSTLHFVYVTCMYRTSSSNLAHNHIHVKQAWT